MHSIVYVLFLTVASTLLNIYAACFTVIGDWICKACANTLGLKTGVEGHEWNAEEAKDKQEEQLSSQDEGHGNALVDSSDDEEDVPVRRKKRRKVLEIDSDSDE